MNQSDMMKTLPLVFAVFAALTLTAAELPRLVGDGVHDDTAAIQARLDSGTSCVHLPPPATCYLISKTLKIGSDTELRLDRFSVIRLAPKSDCPMIENKGYVGGNDRRIALTGGVWDMANVDQSPNPQQYRHCTPPRKGGLPPKHENAFFFGMAMRFSHVEGMTVKGLTVRNPTSYGMAFCHTSYFVIDDISFDYTTCNPIFLNMDGVHFDGFCHHGKISNLRGTCFDDLVALNANDGQCAQEEGDITDIDIDGLYADYCHSAVRLLSTGANLKRVTIRNVHGNFYTYVVGLTHYFSDRKTRGIFDDIVIRDVFCGKVFSPENIGYYSRTNYPTIWVEGAVDVGKLVIDNFNRDERNIDVSTIRVDSAARVHNLILRDSSFINRLDRPVALFDIRGRVEKAMIENLDFLPTADAWKNRTLQTERRE
jgi:polygalacturonase